MIKSHFLNLELSELELSYDSRRRALWFYMKGEPVPCFTVTLLKELNNLFGSIKQTNNTHRQIDYLVAASGKRLIRTVTPEIHRLWLGTINRPMVNLIRDK